MTDLSTTLQHDSTRFEAFAATYTQCLSEAATKPGLYAWPASEAPTVARKMLQTMAARGVCAVNIDGPAFRACGRKLGLGRITYRTLEAYLRGSATEGLRA